MDEEPAFALPLAGWLRLRRGTASDAPAVARLAATALPTLGDAEEVRRFVEAPHAELWLAETREPDPPGTGLQGFLLANRVAGEVEVLWMAVGEASRRRGLGRLLVQRALEGACGAHLEVRAGNEAAQRLYRSSGFCVAGRRPRYYADGEDALRMRWDPLAPGG